jgi:hypothetical protein
VDDSFLEQLAQSQAVGTLEQLDLSLCGITNAGLAHLRPFTHLRFASLYLFISFLFVIKLINK